VRVRVCARVPACARADARTRPGLGGRPGPGALASVGSPMLALVASVRGLLIVRPAATRTRHTQHRSRGRPAGPRDHCTGLLAPLVNGSALPPLFVSPIKKSHEHYYTGSWALVKMARRMRERRCGHGTGAARGRDRREKPAERGAVVCAGGAGTAAALLLPLLVASCVSCGCSTLAAGAHRCRSSGARAATQMAPLLVSACTGRLQCAPLTRAPARVLCPHPHMPLAARTPPLPVHFPVAAYRFRVWRCAAAAAISGDRRRYQRRPVSCIFVSVSPPCSPSPRPRPPLPLPLSSALAAPCAPTAALTRIRPPLQQQQNTPFGAASPTLNQQSGGNLFGNSPNQQQTQSPLGSNPFGFNGAQQQQQQQQQPSTPTLFGGSAPVASPFAAAQVWEN
jgi:hypothetical protein